MDGWMDLKYTIIHAVKKKINIKTRTNKLKLKNNKDSEISRVVVNSFMNDLNFVSPY